jgi:hypothetical protein
MAYVHLMEGIMTLRTQGNYSYGDTHLDIREYLRGYSERVTYPIEHFADAQCACGNMTFRLALDDDVGAATRTCTACGHSHPIGDSGDYLEDAELGEAECPCGGDEFEITAGLSLYKDSEDVKWLYIGCRCVKCGLTACYGDWKSEFNGYRDLLDAI